MADKLITTRNLVSGDIGPLRRMTGVLDSMPTEAKTYGEGEKAKPRTQVVINLKQLEVIEAVEVYTFPTWTSQPLTLSNRSKSRWGVLADSFNNLVDTQLYTKEQLMPKLPTGEPNPAYVPPKNRMDIEACIGKRIGLVMADGEEGRPTPPDLFDQRAADGKGADVPTPTWMFYMVEGVGVAGATQQTPLELAMSYLDGKTLAEFNQKALADPILRTSELLTAISMPESAPASFANTMISSGKFTKDATTGVFKKVA